MRRLGLMLGTMLGVATLAGCAKGDLPWTTLETRYETPASRFADLPGGLHVHYRDEGHPSGPAVVLVHGFAASLQAWEPWAARLGGDYRVITLDLPGHGLTRAPQGYIASTDGNVAVVDELTRRLGVSRFVIGGNSMGGGVAWNYALAHPERLRGLILVDAAGGPPDPVAKANTQSPVFFKLLSNPVGRSLLKSVDPTPIARQGLTSAYVDPKLVTPQLVDRYVDLARAPGHKDILLTMQNRPRRPLTPETFAAIHTPTLVMSGLADKVIPVANSQRLAAAIPGAKLVLYPGVGHVPMEQIPDRSAADAAAFLKSLPQG